MKPVEFDAFADIVVMGYNPEMADYDNRSGAIYGYASYVRAIDAQGNTRIWHIATDYREAAVLEEATAQADALNRRLASGKLPVGFDQWDEGRAVYGTPAWEAYGNDEQLAFEREMDEFGY